MNLTTAMANHNHLMIQRHLVDDEIVAVVADAAEATLPVVAAKREVLLPVHRRDSNDK